MLIGFGLSPGAVCLLLVPGLVTALVLLIVFTSRRRQPRRIPRRWAEDEPADRRTADLEAEKARRRTQPGQEDQSFGITEEPPRP